MKEQDLKILIKEVVRECVKEASCGDGHLAGGAKGKRMFKHIKKGYKGEKDPENAKKIAAATVNKQLGEYDKVTSDSEPSVCSKCKEPYSDDVDPSKNKHNLCPDCGNEVSGYESDRQQDHQNEAGAISEYDESEELKLIRGLNLITKKLLGMHKGLDVDKHEKEDHVDENGPQYKVRDGRSYVEQPGKVNRAREIQKDPKVNEASHKVQARSFKTIKDVDQNPKNPADPEVPMSEALTEAKKLLAKIKASRKK